MVDADFGGNLLSTWKEVYEKEPIDQIITRFDWEDSVHIIAFQSPAEPSFAHGGACHLERNQSKLHVSAQIQVHVRYSGTLAEIPNEWILCFAPICS
jgi:hypothetical protein